MRVPSRLERLNALFRREAPRARKHAHRSQPNECQRRQNRRGANLHSSGVAGPQRTRCQDLEYSGDGMAFAVEPEPEETDQKSSGKSHQQDLTPAPMPSMSFAHRRFASRLLGACGTLRSRGGLSLENDLGHGSLANVESIVDLALLGARNQQTLPRILQISAPKNGGVLGANDGFGGGAIKHLLASRVIVKAFDRLRDHLALQHLFTQRMSRLQLHINPGTTQLAVR